MAQYKVCVCSRRAHAYGRTAVHTKLSAIVEIDGVDLVLGVHCPISSTFLYENFPKNMEGKRLGGKEMETINMDNLLQRKQRSGELEGNVRVADKFLFF